jgi:KUP system potassium uptake protein
VSLIFWSLIIVISFKYAILVMRADNHGEGGILALLALVSPRRAKQSRRRAALVGVGLVGATPALRRRHDHAGDFGVERYFGQGGCC